MTIVENLPNYDGDGIDIFWDRGSEYSINITKNAVVLSANKTALISMAKQMLYMAYNDLPEGSHIHYDSFFTEVEDNEYELIIEKKTGDGSLSSQSPVL